MITLFVIIGYLCLLLALGFFSNRLFRGTSKDYFVASHSIGPFLLLMSVFGTTMTAFALVGSTGKSFERGIGTYGLMASISGIRQPRMQGCGRPCKQVARSLRQAGRGPHQRATTGRSQLNLTCISGVLGEAFCR